MIRKTYKLIILILLFTTTSYADGPGDKEKWLGFVWGYQPLEMEFVIGKPQSKNIEYYLDWKNNYANTVKVVINELSPLPPGVKLVNKIPDRFYSIEWTPSKDEMLRAFTIPIQVVITDPENNIFTYKNDLIIKTISDDPTYADNWDLHIECSQTLQSYQIQQVEECADCPKIKEDEFNYPDYDSSPSNLGAILSKFAIASVKHDELTGAQLFFSEYLSSYFKILLKKQENGKYLPDNLRKAINGLSYYLDPKQAESFRTFNIGKSFNPNTASYQFYNYNLLGELLHLIGTRILNEGSVSLNFIYLEILDRINKEFKHRGIEEQKLYTYYLMLSDETNLVESLFDLASDQNDRVLRKNEIISKIVDLFERKTTPNLTCNNLASKIISKRIKYTDLGMELYEPPINPLYWSPVSRYFAPWLTDAIVQNVGKNAYDHPEVWELSKVLPLFGTTLAILDGAMTLYTGEDLQANKTDRRFAALMLGLDLVPASIGAFAKFKNVGELTALVNEVKQLKATSKLDHMMLAANKSIDKLKKFLKYSDLPIGAIPCGLSSSARLADNNWKLISEKHNVYGAKPSDMGEKLCVVNTFKYFEEKQVQLSHSIRSFYDTNLLKSIGHWELLLKKYSNNIRKAFDNINESSDQMRFHVFIRANAASEVGKKYGIKKAFATNAGYNELAHGQGLLNLSELEILVEKTDLSFISGPYLSKLDIASDPIGPNFGTMQEAFHDYLRKYGFGDEIKADGSLHRGETTRNGGPAGDLNIFLQFISTYRMNNLADTPIPTMFISDRQFGVDIYNLVKGDNLVSKYGNLEEAYKAILNATAGKQLPAKLTRESMYNALVKKAGESQISKASIPDFSNLPFKIVYLPLNCGHFDSYKSVRDAFPELYQKLKVIRSSAED